VNRPSDKIQMMSRALGEGFLFDVTHQCQCGSFQGKECSCEFAIVISISKQFGGSCASNHGAIFADGPALFLPDARGNGCTSFRKT